MSRKAHAIRPHPTVNEAEPKPGFIVGSGNRKGGSKTQSMRHNGMVMGGSVTTQRQSVSGKSINRLSSNRTDGRVV